MRTGLLLLYKNNRMLNNDALTYFQNRVSQLIVVIIEDTSNSFSRQFAQTNQSDAVRRACDESQQALVQQLQLKNIDVAINAIDDLKSLSILVDTFRVDVIASSFHPSMYFQTLCQKLKANHPCCEYLTLAGNTLFEREQLPFTLQNLPKTFSQFRKAVEPLSNDLLKHHCNNHESTVKPQSPHSSSMVQFNEQHARAHLEFYFSSSYPSHYKQTRNQLFGAFFSTGFSPYLAHGVLGVKEIVNELVKYEHLYGRNESTEWIYVELLWREYFYWYGASHLGKLFKKAGLNVTAPLTSFYAQPFKAWCEGHTPSPLVNAIMRELKTTGWISNRARLISASYLIHELQLDWRHGAAYFEQVLIDYDVAINWGNWQYIAGVGADPRGGRHFNVQKQTELYDADGSYRSRWLTHADESHSLNLEYWA